MPKNATTAPPLQEWQEAVWLLIVLATPLFVNLWVEQLFEPSKVSLLRSLVWVLAALWLYAWMFGPRPKPLPRSIRNLVIALALVLLLSTYLSAYRYIAVFGTLDRANGLLTQISYLVLFACIATLINVQRSRRLLHVIILTAVPICLLGLAQATGWQPFPLLTDARSPITTTLGRANFTGAYLATLVPLTLTAAQSATSAWRRTGYAIISVLELIVIALAQARASWVALLVGMGILLWLRAMPRWSSRARWLSALGGSVALAGGLWLILQRGIASGGSIAARWTIWQAALRLVRPRLWLGYGADTLELYFPSVYPPQLVYYQGRGVVVDRAHNWLLDWSLNYGVVATAIVATIVFLILRQGLQQLTSRTTSDTSPLDRQQLESRWLAACMAAICIHLIGNLFLFEVAATAVLFWVLLAILTATTFTHHTSPTDARHETTTAAVSATAESHANQTRYVVAGLFIVLSVAILGWAVWQSNVRPLLADAHSWRGTSALNRGDVSTALAEYTMAVQQQPLRPAYRVAVALTAAELGDYVQAEQTMQQAIALRPADPVLRSQLAALYARQATNAPEKISLAYDAYERAIALAPTIALTYQQYADLALRAGDIEMAQRQAQRALDLDATDGIAFGILGWAQLHNGNLRAAQDAFERAVKWQPNSADFHLGLATVHYQQGNLDAANQALQDSLMIDPNYGPSLTLRLHLEE